MMNPDLIVLEECLSITNGYDIARRLKKKNYLCRIIMIDQSEKQKRENIPENVCEIIRVGELTHESLCKALKGPQSGLSQRRNTLAKVCTMMLYNVKALRVLP
jgi:chemotaxis response regulator CheB